jgi:NarL family two-component system response regulator LiaR
VAEIRLLIAEDDPTVCTLLAQWLGGEQGMVVVAQALNGVEAVALARQHRPDVVLMDLRMPELDGIAATQQIKQALPDCAVVALTIHRDDEHLFPAIRAGALGYVLKSSSPERIVEAVQAAARGEGFLDQSLVGKVMEEFARVGRLREAAKTVFAELTRRELEVLELLGRGLRNREIAERLFLSEKTVKSHVSSIPAKLHVNHRGEAAYLAERHGLTERE